MKGLSEKEMEVVADLDFRKLSYFTLKDVEKHFTNLRQRTNTIYKLRKKGRIIKLNRSKFFLVPIKAQSGGWADNPLIVADEIFNGKDYVIGGWYAAYYWKLTDQIPMQVDIYTTRRQGTMRVLGKRFVFHRSTKKKIAKAVPVITENYQVKMLDKNYVRAWLRSRR